MLLQRKLQNVLMLYVLMFVGISFLVPNCLAQSGAWDQKADRPTARCFAASCELNGKIYVIGGCKTAYSSLNVMEVYDPVTDTWDTTKTDMPTARAELCVAAVNGKIYAIGGATSHTGSPLGMVEEYDPLTDSWDTNKTPMPTARMGAAYGVINNIIYVAGGTAGSHYEPSKKLEIYDPATDTWTSRANMLAGRYEPEGVVLNDTLYVIGGLIGSPWTGQKAVQIYDPTTDSWEWVPGLNYGRVGSTANVVNGKIYVIGGDTQPPIIMNVEEYDPTIKTWSVIDQTPSAMPIHTSSVYDSVIYVFIGSIKTLMELTLTNSVYSFDPRLVDFIDSQKNQTPEVFVLHQNYPNPFNPRTNIQFSIPKSEYVTLKIYNLLGQDVTTLVSEKLKAGVYIYTWNAGSLASGVYLYYLQAGDYRETRKMILLQ